MKKLVLVMAILLLGTPLFVSNLDAYPLDTSDQLRIHLNSTYGGENHGGVFFVDVVGEGKSYKSWDSIGTSDFFTFCVERAEYFSPGSYYPIYSLTHTIIHNGVNGATDLTYRTAWLYKQAVDGTLLGGYSVSDRDDNTALQVAIWRAQGLLSDTEQTDWLPSGSHALTWWDASAAASGFYGVKVINLGTNANNQDMLNIDPVPEPGTLLLLGSGLAGLAGIGWWRHRRP